MSKQTDDLSKAIALGTMAASVLQKSHINEYTKRDGTVVQEHEDSRIAEEASNIAREASHKAKKTNTYDDHTAAAKAHHAAYQAHEKARQHNMGGKELTYDIIKKRATHSGPMADHQHAAKSHEDAANKASHEADESPKQETAEHKPGGDDFQKAVFEAQGAADLLQKSHVKEHTRTSASGAVSQVNAYDDKRQTAEKATAAAEKKPYKWGHDAHNREAATLHREAAMKHIEAMHEAHKAGDNEAVTKHYYAAGHHLAMHGGGITGEKRDKRTTDYHAQEAARIAHDLSHQADTHGDHGEDTAVDLNHKTSIHMLAMEAHARAANAHQQRSVHFRGGTPGAHEVTGNIGWHKEEAARHGDTVSKTAGKSVEATENAYKDSERADHTGKAEDHRAAAEAHKYAARLNYDPEGKEDHEKKAQEHEAASKGSEDRQLGAPHSDPITKHAEALHKVALKHNNSNEDRDTLESASRHMKADDHESLASTLKTADTYQREAILDHVHPDHWEGLGMQHIDKARALKRYEEKHQGK